MVCNRVPSLTLSLGLLLGLLSGHHSPVKAQFSAPNSETPISSGGRTLQFSPPDRGAPDSADGGATRRSDCIHVVPLMPVDDRNIHFGLTYQEHPSFYWYIGSAKAGLESAKIIIERDNNQGDIEEVHRVNVSLPSTLNDREHILQFSASPDEPGLAVDELYRWYLEIQCNPLDLQDPTSLMIYEGWIERVEPDVEIAQGSTPREASSELAYQYGTAGIWFDYLQEMVSTLDAWSYILSGFGIIQPETDVDILRDETETVSEEPNVTFYPLVRHPSSSDETDPDETDLDLGHHQEWILDLE
ncbi:DUF928 domain-containing protein [Sodalinema gerasimenkoae]|uniref:DUF928 domain-containing protein n=1 Tax=Sodalinema gerasimenkoae TaxID=2862348 RepID=UPI00135A994B|nr:DUF928 domain-containing protein [Sodalinema gerasimenkoae]